MLAKKAQKRINGSSLPSIQSRVLFGSMIESLAYELKAIDIS
jgi:hypothetical protein